jgi:hypothetical protein
MLSSSVAACLASFCFREAFFMAKPYEKLAKAAQEATEATTVSFISLSMLALLPRPLCYFELS